VNPKKKNKKQKTNKQTKYSYPHVFQYKCLNPRRMRSTVKKRCHAAYRFVSELLKQT